VEVATPVARAEVYLQGAHVTAYAPRGGAPVLFLSRASRFERGAPIRGGIPIVFRGSAGRRAIRARRSTARRGWRSGASTGPPPTRPAP
jgi:D-hexose-6-phosphate mutarotase